ncbi:MAG: bifunctional histidinol-phosphatase/imidazoleglycerol-phosphate dehydratase HisB [Bacteroidales bacterium]
MSTKYLFIDRDGTIIKEPPDEQIDSLEKLEFKPGVIRNLYRITNLLNYKLVMVSNQDGLGSVGYPRETFDKIQQKMLKTLQNEGIEFEAIRVDTSTAEVPSDKRKPSAGLIKDYLKAEFDREKSVVIGDRITDVEMAKNAGIRALWLNDKTTRIPQELKESCLLVTNQWDEIYNVLNALGRTSSISRISKETRITGSLTLDGQGISRIETGLGFFNHMLEQLSHHGNMDLELQVSGDLRVDEHHTIEDTGLALGEAFSRALENKKGLNRYGFYVPMDDSLASCVVDFGGRAFLDWNVSFKREKIGDVPTEMFSHFFRSFCENARCNLHITAKGENEHHKIEAVFKALARALKTAVKQDKETEQIPTTKGMI